MRTSLSIRITAACLLLAMAACTTWQPYPYELERGTGLPERIRVNLVTSESVQLASPFLEGDTTLVGRVRTRSSAVSRRVPLRDVSSLEWRAVSRGRTAAAGVVVLIAGLAYFYWALSSMDLGICVPCGGGR